jgi:4-hydroxybenzoate polyprenyltransferase
VSGALAAHVALTRPAAWLWFDLVPAATTLALLGSTRSPRETAAFLVAVVLADAGGSTLNDACDVEVDRASDEPSRRNRPVASSRVSVRAAFVQAAALLLAGPALLAAVAPPSAGWMVLAVAGGVAYSLPPLRLVGRPWGSLLVWPWVGGAAYLSVASFAGRIATLPALVYLGGVGVFYVLGETLAKDLRDLGADRAGGRRTAAARLGVAPAARLSVMAGLLGGGALAALAAVLPTRALFASSGAFAVGIWVGVAGAVWTGFGRTAVEAARTLRAGYRAEAAIALHRAFVRTYLLLSLAVLGGALLR